MATLSGQVASGAVWNTTATLIRIGSNVLVLPILARLLSAEDFGIVQMAMPIILLALSVSDGGLVPVLVRSQHVSPILWSSALVTNLLLAVLLTAAIGLAAPQIGAYYRTADAGLVLMALSSVLLLQAFSSVPHAWLQRELRLKTIAVCEAVANIFGVAVAIVMALQGGGAWALVGQQLTLYLVKALLHVTVARPPLAGAFSIRAMRAVLPQCWRYASAQAASSSGLMVAPLLIGRVLDATALGFYALAVRLTDFASQVFGVGLRSTLLPALARLPNDGRLKAGSLKVFRYLALMVFPVLAGLAALAAPLVEIVLGGTMKPVAGLIPILAPAAALQFVIAIAGVVLTATGAADAVLRLSLARTLLTLAALPIGLNWGLTGAAVAELAAVAILTFPAASVLMGRLQGGLGEFVATLAPPALFSAAMAVAVTALVDRMQALGFTCLAVLAAGLCAGVVIYLSLVFAFARGLLVEARSLLFEARGP